MPLYINFIGYPHVEGMRVQRFRKQYCNRLPQDEEMLEDLRRNGNTDLFFVSQSDETIGETGNAYGLTFY